MAEIVLVAGKRTPFGKFGGSLINIPAVELGAHVLNVVMSEVPQLRNDEIDYVHLGLCLPGSGLSPARQAALAAGWPVTTNGMTIDRACCSGLTAVGMAVRDIRMGVARAVVAGGMENMSRTPYLIPQVRWGNRLGDVTVTDDLVIRNPYVGGGAPMAQYVGETALANGVGREEQDVWALRSNQYWAAACDAGRFGPEIAPIEVTVKDGVKLFEVDEHPRRDGSLEKLARLKPVYGSPTVTAGNASGIADGAAALLVCSSEIAKERGMATLATVVGYTSLCGEPRESALLPGVLIRRLLGKLDLSLDDMLLIEINEAFAAMPLVSSLVLADFDRPKAEKIREKINVNGGAVAIGHPLGATGGRVTLTLANELRRRGGGYGIVAICGSMGQVDAAVLRVD